MHTSFIKFCLAPLSDSGDEVGLLSEIYRQSRVMYIGDVLVTHLICTHVAVGSSTFSSRIRLE